MWEHYKENYIVKKIVLAFVLAAIVAGLAGCADGSGDSSDNGSSSVGLSSSIPAESSSSSVPESPDSSAPESSVNSETESSDDSETSSESSESSETGGSETRIHLSVCDVPAWGITDNTEKQNVFMAGSEYEDYRVLQTAVFEGGALKELKVRVYVVSDKFDMSAFKQDWGFEPAWNGECYEGEPAIPEEYAGKSADEIKLLIAKPVLKKYGAETLDGMPEIVMVDPSTVPDPAIDF